MLPLPSSVGLTWAQRLNAENRLNNTLASTVTSVSMVENVQKTIGAAEFPENLVPIVLTADDLDPTNTRLFVKSLSPELHDYSFLYRLFRYFGRIRMLALNTKRHNAIVEYETKEAALAAKRDCRCVSALSGRTYTIKMFWGKHINREPPVKNTPPTFIDQIKLCRDVHASTVRELTSAIPMGWLNQLVMQFKSSSTAEELGNLLTDQTEDSAPPGLMPAAEHEGNIVLGRASPWAQMFSLCDIDGSNLGQYPLKSSDTWFCPEPRVTRPSEPVETPTLQLKRVLSPNPYAQNGLVGMLTFAKLVENSREPFCNFEAWDAALTGELNEALNSPFANMYTWETSVQPAKFGGQKTNNIAPGSPSASSLVPRLPTSPSNSTVSLNDLIYSDADDINIPFDQSLTPAKKLHFAAIASPGKAEALADNF